ncbi:MAG: hypothetical protein COY57_06205, partial [Flavobacteriales bacterium CG_4_10_14_0_8_um_filter_32_5]
MKDNLEYLKINKLLVA